ncbi:MAG TPA: baseplate J/gp47 family protein [Ktedonobacteraceae bacterium]
MPLPSPNLDDRDFRQLVAEELQRIKQDCPTWTDLSPGDPGVVLLEVFAHLMETMIYRLNRVPDKVYIELLRLIDTRLQPPGAARVSLAFSRAGADDQMVIQIPRGTRVTLDRSGSSSEAVIFTTAEDAALLKGDTQIEVPAYHCDLIRGELAGTGTGFPGQVIKALQPPIIASTGDDRDLVVGVEAKAEELNERVPAIKYGDKTYRVWRETENFTGGKEDPYIYISDRMAGTVIFAPAARLRQSAGPLEETAQALAALPEAGREIRLWYRRGGGLAGNVEANTLTQLKDALAGVQVTNPGPAVGGAAAETLENARVRGPQQLYSLQRAVTARDFEAVAFESSQSVARAKALTRATLWTFATPGTVEVLLVPSLPEEKRGGGQVTIATLQQYQTEDARSGVQRALEERRPLGTTCIVNWAHYKVVHVKAKIAVRRQEDPQAVKQRVIERLYQTISPLKADWPFGQALRASHIYDVALEEPGVRWVDQVRLLVDEVPDDKVATVVADTAQPETWYVSSGTILFRSLNDGEGWEAAGRFAGEEISLVKVHSGRSGLLSIVTNIPGTSESRLHISWNCAETWAATVYSLAFQVQDLVWVQRGDVPALLLATSAGLYELAVAPGSSPVQILVDPTNQALGFYSIAAGTDVRGSVNVAVAAQNTGGVYLSSSGGGTGTFRHIGLRGQDIRELVIEQAGPRSFLWVGATSSGGDDPGKGCLTWELHGSENPPEGWQPFGKNWEGGTCRSIVFAGAQVIVATHRAGVLRLKRSEHNAAWQKSDVRCGLPLRDPGRFFPVLTLATDPKNPASQQVMAGGEKGVFCSKDGGLTFISSSSKEFSDKVTLPATWLFVSSEHDITVVSENEAE